MPRHDRGSPSWSRIVYTCDSMNVRQLESCSADWAGLTDEEQQKVLVGVQRDFDLVEWLHSMGPWDVIAHFTWRDKPVRLRDGTHKFVGASEWVCQRGIERFMAELPGVSYFYSVEKNPSRDGHHVHALWGDCANVFRNEMWARWKKLHGRCRIEPVRCAADVEGYASKYVMKLPCWWNVKLRWHRHQKLNNVPFSLSGISSPGVSAGGLCPGSEGGVVGPGNPTPALPSPSLQKWSPLSSGIFRPISHS